MEDINVVAEVAGFWTMFCLSKVWRLRLLGTQSKVWRLRLPMPRRIRLGRCYLTDRLRSSPTTLAENVSGTQIMLETQFLDNSLLLAAARLTVPVILDKVNAPPGCVKLPKIVSRLPAQLRPVLARALVTT